MARRTALVTGASRGIGKAIALALAAKGFDVAITARTVHEGEGRVAGTDQVLPGSLDTTAAAITAAGRHVLPVPMDLMDPVSIAVATTVVMDAWGPPDVLVNNAIYQGAGRQARFLETSDEDLGDILTGNVLSQWRIIRAILPAMLERGDGTILNITSAAGMNDPPLAAGEGGWSLGYGASKAAFHRTAGVLHAEYGRAGLRVFNLEPGLVYTERMVAIHGDYYKEASGGTGTTPDVIGAVAAYLVTDTDAERWRGRTLHAQPFAEKRGITPST